MIARVLLAVILSGIAAGLLMGLIQHVRLTPLILQAETFEHVAHGHGADAHSHGDATWSPQDGIERTFYTTLSAVVTAVGFGLLMVGMAFTFKFPFNSRNAWIWGLCGFLTLSFAPAVGLPPELPGMPAADVNSRIYWWLGCVGLTAIGLHGVYRVLNGLKVGWFGILAILLPHVIVTPPVATEHTTQVPAHLAAQFVSASLGANLVMWIVLSITLGYALRKFESIFTS